MEECCVSRAIVVDIGTPIPKPAAPTCIRKRRREVRSASLIILCAGHDYRLARHAEPLPVWYLRNRMFLDMSQQATERARRQLLARLRHRKSADRRPLSVEKRSFSGHHREDRF